MNKENKNTKIQMMEIQPAILNLQELGQMPDDSIIEDMELSGKYDELLYQVKTPINYREAEILVKLFPEESFFEVEFALLHLFETAEISNEKYWELIRQCSSLYWREILLNRFGNVYDDSTRLEVNDFEIQRDEQIEIFYHNSQKYTGTIFEEFDNCMISKFEVKNGIKNGISKTYFENGNVKSFSEYKNGLLDGLTINYSESGDSQKEAIFERGICIYYKLYDAVTGKVEEQFSMMNDKDKTKEIEN
jgi:hypothetical protein